MKSFSIVRASIAGAIAIGILGLGVILLPQVNAAGVTTSDGISLEELIILDSLMDNEVGVTDDSGTTTDDGDGLDLGNLDVDSDLGKLLVLQSLFNGGVGIGGGTSVMIESGDTLSAIALQFLGDASLADEIAAQNGIVDADFIQTGQVITIPQVSGTSNTMLGGSSLGRLILLDKLFNDDDSVDGEDNSNLEELIIINALFNGRAIVI